jgi:hypothetical protein
MNREERAQDKNMESDKLSQSKNLCTHLPGPWTEPGRPHIPLHALPVLGSSFHHKVSLFPGIYGTATIVNKWTKSNPSVATLLCRSPAPRSRYPGDLQLPLPQAWRLPKCFPRFGCSLNNQLLAKSQQKHIPRATPASIFPRNADGCSLACAKESRSPSLGHTCGGCQLHCFQHLAPGTERGTECQSSSTEPPTPQSKQVCASVSPSTSSG